MRYISYIITILAVLYAGYLIYQNTKEPVDQGTSENQEVVVQNEQQEVQENSNATSTPALLSVSDETYCADLKAGIPGSDGFVITTDVASGEILGDGFVVSGCVYNINESYGGWAPFEGQVGTVEIVADGGPSLGVYPLTVADMPNWLDMAIAGEDIAYQTTLNFDSGTSTAGTLIFRNENASGEPALDASTTVPVLF